MSLKRPILSEYSVRNSLIPVTMIACLIGAGIAQGRLSVYGNGSEELARAVQRMTQFPGTIGSWVSSDLEKDPEELAVAEAEGYLLRRYTNKVTGSEVTVLMLCGRPGPISVHPPTACYRARGYRLSSSPVTTQLPEPVRDDHFRLAEFHNSASLADDRVAILWAWSTDGQWSVPENPRLAFGGEPFLYKLYITWSRTRDERELQDSLPTDFCKSFLAGFTEAVDRS